MKHQSYKITDTNASRQRINSLWYNLKINWVLVMLPSPNDDYAIRHNIKMAVRNYRPFTNEALIFTKPKGDTN